MLQRCAHFTDKNWIAASDEEIVEATMTELARIFPREIGQGAPGGGAKLLKGSVVRVPRSVYAATPGRRKFRPSQQSPVANFVMAGDFALQKYLGSMEGAVLSGKLAAEVVCDTAAGRPVTLRREWGCEGLADSHKIQHSDRDPGLSEREPVGVRGVYPIAFGGGQQGVGADISHP
jgi:15-cis-phytoene desaturase